MTWPGWTDVLPVLTVIAALLGAAWAWARLSDRTVSRAVEKAGEEAKDAARDAADSLYSRLKENDFKHVEDRIGEGLRGVSERLDRMEARAREDRVAMEARILAAVRAPGAPATEDSPPPG